MNFCRRADIDYFRLHRSRPIHLVLPFWMAILLLLAASCSRRMAPPKPYLAFVALAGSQSVAAVDLATFDSVKAIPLGFAPDRLIVRPNSSDVYATSANGDVAVIHYPQLSVAEILHGGGVQPDLTFTGQGRTGYGIDREGRAIFVLDGATDRILARYPLSQPVSQLALTPDGKTLLGAEAADGRILFFSAGDGRLLGNLAIGKNLGDLVMLPDSLKAFVADPKSEMVAALQIPSRELLSNIQIGAPATLLALKPDGGEIFAFSANPPTMTLLDATSDAVEESLAAAANITATAFTKNSSMLYLASAADGDVIALNVPQRRVMSTTHVGIEPVALAITPDERFVAIADAAAGRLAVMLARVAAYPKGAISQLDQAVYGSSLMVATIPVGANPVDVVVPGWLWPPAGQGSR
jgi:DNA-binding beta-propeller fold protein YncE